ncbi:mannose-1-phosphate guanylyltransferase/mannose-6-phosphate isomerase [Pseudomonas sp. R5(2019)]|uniref:mannose-1-phosphate guanylyltransferase/mannose-6-phosphate isomerase n=1 Tax=Pseudomonas sp. R5(2019) TaxID=2697566 RepID=UPI00141290D4|nr:mannose-1-phosphate guanylyltransferase/mannose-6-phosphate isomerase [Pseudomonas sp. R5(2019)]NBA98232.1 mannose-1-phosphate guanylyltransferase/mannose-6-phosphate isomerase [Pseudomonas sp. R5(2019)]
MNNSVLPIIMAGGSGSRLWPLSRQLNPKQFLALGNTDESMLQTSINRLENLNLLNPLIICNEEHRFIAAEQLRQLGNNDSSIILEPVSRNTAPAITLAALHSIQNGNDPFLLILAADHHIENNKAFEAAVSNAFKLASTGKLVTFGIKPTHPETGYGYISMGEELEYGGYAVRSFVEKPDASTAQKYIASGDYLWNSGMFMFKASHYLEELKKYHVDIFNACEKSLNSCSTDSSFIRIDSDSFKSCPDISVDYAVMEKTTSAAMVSLDAGWSDIGSWSALWAISDKSDSGNVLKGDILAHDTNNTYVHSDNRLIATVGIDNLIVIETKDAVLIAHKDKVQDVKKIVDQLKINGRTEHLLHREVYRPWGAYDSIDKGERYQVKRITVKPGAKLSVQMHHHRAEHWIVVSGTAKVTNGENTYLVTENQSTYIPIGQVHALENPGVIPLELIEVQSGSYLGEDDIVRFEDKYGRA